MLHPKKVGTLPKVGSDEVKQTNEIGMIQALFDAIDIQGKDITVDALLTQRKFAQYLIDREAHYHFTVKGNQRTLEKDIRDAFENRRKPHYEIASPPEHGRIETRRIWVTSSLNKYLDFLHVGQAYCIEREIINAMFDFFNCVVKNIAFVHFPLRHSREGGNPVAIISLFTGFLPSRE